MVEKEKKEASDEGHEAPRPLRFWFHRNPKGEILQKSVQELCRGHDEKEPLQPGFRNVVGPRGLGRFGWRELLILGDVDGSCYERILMSQWDLYATGF